MEQQVCQFQTVSTKGFTPELCAKFVPNKPEYWASVGPNLAPSSLSTVLIIREWRTAFCARV